MYYHSMYILHSDDRIFQNSRTCVDSVIRKHPECGVIITGDFNQMNDSFLMTHYTFSQIVKVFSLKPPGASNRHTRQNMDEYEYGVFQASNSGRIGNLRPQ